ncbi:MAG: PriCT-2 domain-containing protein [Magnetococcales bacterium]|nr:PriCT-2 domain-containing protein [Magnetococcales bacterium]
MTTLPKKSPVGGPGDTMNTPLHYAKEREYKQPSLEELDSALHSQDPNCDRDRWAKICAAYKAGGGNFESFNQWSQGGATYNASDCRDTWKSFNASGGVTARTLFGIAHDTGWMWSGNEKARPLNSTLSHLTF